MVWKGVRGIEYAFWVTTLTIMSVSGKKRLFSDTNPRFFFHVVYNVFPEETF